MKQKLRDALERTLNDDIVKAHDAVRTQMSGLVHLIVHPDSAKFVTKATVQFKDQPTHPQYRPKPPVASISSTPKSEVVDAMLAATRSVQEFFDRKKHIIEYEVYCLVGDHVHIPVPEEFWKRHEYAA